MGYQSSIDAAARVEIYQFQMYDVSTDMMITSTRWGTSSAIEALFGVKLDATKRLVDAAVVNSDVYGLTAKGYMPD